MLVFQKLLTWLFLWISCLMKLSDSAIDCVGQLSYVVFAKSELLTRTVGIHPAVSLNDCLQMCTESSNCQTVNFQRSNDGEVPQCSLLEAKMSSQQPLVSTNQSLYYGESICLPSFTKLCNKSWTFEFVPNMSLKKSALIMEQKQTGTIEECLVTCLKQPRECRGVAYQNSTSQCLLSRINRHSIRTNNDYFTEAAGWNFYESNCVEEPSNRCNFLLKKREGMTKLYTMRQSGVVTALDCQHVCLETMPTESCRHFTFDIDSRTCYTSHVTSAQARIYHGNSLISYNKESLESGDIDDCVDFHLRCRDNSMVVDAQTRRLFVGTISAKHSETQPTCVNRIEDNFQFSSSFPYNDCETLKEGDGRYTNVMFMKYGDSNLITYKDKLIKVVCKIVNVGDLSVSTRISVSNRTEQEAVVVTGSPAGVKFKLEVLDSRGNPVEKINIGDFGYLEISTDNSTLGGIEASNIIASNGNGEETLLFDDFGCPTDTKITSGLEQISPHKLRAQINFFSFQDSAKVLYRGLVKQCLPKCDPVPKITTAYQSKLLMNVNLQPCSGKHFRYKRKASLSLEDEQYLIFAKVAVQQKLVQISPKQTGQNVGFTEILESTTIDPVIKVAKSHPIIACLTESFPCLMTVVFAMVQALLLTMCAAAVFLYCRKYKRRWARRISDSMNEGNVVEIQNFT